MQNDYLDLLELEVLCTLVKSSKADLHKSIDSLLKINPASSELQSICFDYEECLSNGKNLSRKYGNIIANPK